MTSRKDESTRQVEEMKAPAVILSTSTTTKTATTNLPKEVAKPGVKMQTDENQNDVTKLVIIALSEDREKSSQPKDHNLATGTKNKKFETTKKENHVRHVYNRPAHGLRSRPQSYRAGYGNAPYAPSNQSRYHNHGGQWVQPPKPHLQSSARQGHHATRPAAVAPCLPPGPWLPMAPCYPPAPWMPVAPCLPPAPWMPMGPPSSPAPWGSPAPCLPPVSWMPTTSWVSPAPCVPMAPWVPMGPPVSTHWSANYSHQAEPNNNFPENPTVPPYSSPMNSFAPPSYSSSFIDTPPPPYSPAPVDPDMAYSSPPVYTPPPSYSGSSPAVSSPPPAHVTSTLNPTAAPYMLRSTLNPTAAPYSMRSLSSSPRDATSAENSTAAPSNLPTHSSSLLSPAAQPFPARLENSSLTPPPLEPWIPSKEQEVSMELTVLTDVPFSEDPLFSTVWRPLASGFLATSTLKAKTTCDDDDDWDPLSDYEGGSAWSTEC